MASSVISSCSSPAVRRFFTFMLVFGFVGYATASCAQYGHSCWGGHGKRSYENRGAHDARSYRLPNGELSREQWILARLAMNSGLATVTDRHRVPWNGGYEPKAFRDRRYDPVDTPSATGPDNARLSENNNNEEAGNVAHDILLIPEKQTENVIRQPSKLQLLKILNSDEKNLK